jgi:hypothetical protein
MDLAGVDLANLATGNDLAVKLTNLCAGRVTDLMAHPMTALAKPALGQTVTDAEFGTTIRRITAVAAGGANPVIKPMYSTMSAWNADESKMILYDVSNGHFLYDGKTYQMIKKLDIAPADIEQVYWDTVDPDVFYFPSGTSFMRYHVSTATSDELNKFDFCTGGVSNGSDPMYLSWDSHRIGLHCDDQVFLFDIPSASVIARKTITENPAQATASGTMAWLSDSGRLTDASLNVIATLDLVNPSNHSSLGQLANGHDTWNGAVYDPGPMGNDDIGILVTWDLQTRTSKTIIGPKTNFPYPPDGHISAMAYKQPGWVLVSTFGDTTGKGLLDLELLYANTNDGTVCRLGRHRSWGKANTMLQDSYWAEAHAVPSPSGTRVLFASDWGNGATVDSYVLEL